MIKLIKFILKRRRLLKKYKLTQKKMEDDITLVTGVMKDNMEFRRLLLWIRTCEQKCYNRIKNLKAI